MLFKVNFLFSLLWLSVEVANALGPIGPPGPAIPRRKIARGPASSSAQVTSSADGTTSTSTPKGSCKVRTLTTKPASSTKSVPATTSSSKAKAPQCYNYASVDAVEGTAVDYCICSYKLDYISFTPSASQTCPETIPASVMKSLTSTPTTTTGPATITINNWPFTIYGGDGAVTACESSSVVDYAGYPVTQCAGKTSMVHTAVSYSTTINVSPNGMLDYGNWTNFESLDWDKDTDADRTSTLWSAFYTALSTLCHESSTTTVLTVTGLSTDIEKDMVATVTTPTTMYQCAVATATAENIRYTIDEQSEEAKLTVTVPFSHFDLENLDKWVNLTAFALVANAMQDKNTWEGKYMLETGRGPGVEEKIVQHTGPSLVDLSYFSSLNEGILEQFQVQVGFKATESSFDCALMAEAEEFATAILSFFDPAIAAELIPEELSLETLCNLAQGN